MLEPVIKKLEIYEDKVSRAVAGKKRRVLFRQGAYIKTTMQRSLRPSKKSSRPGQPPRVRSTKSPLRQLIEFAVDLLAGSVTAGPKIFPSSKVRSSKTLPELLNEGGTFKQLRPDGGSVLAQVLARPFTAPVFSDGGANFTKLIETEEL